ncbi:MAG: inorganic pyrophosphatase [Oligoflexus sp.]
MSQIDLNQLIKYLKKAYKPHPWHGISAHPENSTELVHAYIEIVPTDTVKYEIDKTSGYLMVDRPQKFSNIVPTLYGFVPRTYCSKKIAGFTMEKVGRHDLVGDGDPLDICVLTERTINHGDLILKAIPVGGFRMIDNDEVDDKIIAVLKDDPIFGAIRDVNECPQKVIDRLLHYFLTYKEMPGESKGSKVEITHTYGREEALTVIELAKQDYQDEYNGIELK